MGTLKRTIDVVLSVSALLLLCPFLVAIAVAVGLGSRGGVLYGGTRTGLHGRPFRMLKFRTMHRDADRLGGGTTARNDPRVTRVGKFLRKWKLDELPQLLNVVVGQMSLVGPRPELPKYTDRYTQEERAILGVRPGITDLASLRYISVGEVVGDEDPDGVYERVVLREKNRLRLLYVHLASLGLDMRILVRTVLSLVTRRPRTVPEEFLHGSWRTPQSEMRT